MSNKWVYLSSEAEEAEAYTGSWQSVRDLLGGLGSQRAEMVRIGLPIPPGFTVTTEACNIYLQTGQFPAGLWSQTLAALRPFEGQMGKELGNADNPLFLVCCSGAKFPLPGLMDTVSYVGLNDETVTWLAEQTGDEGFAYSSYRRLIETFGYIVLDIPDMEFERALDAYKERRDLQCDSDLTAGDWKSLVEAFKAIVREHKGIDFPQDPLEQLRRAIEGAFQSWNRQPAIAYRERQNLPPNVGTAVNVVALPFGNMGSASGTGVVFTRDPGTGEKKLFGDYLMGARCEDETGDLRHTKPIDRLAEEMPEAHVHLVESCATIEAHYGDMQDVEFTIEQGKLWILQFRDGKRTAKAAVKIAVDMASEGLISREEAILRVTPEQVDCLFFPQFDPMAKRQAKRQEAYLTNGIGASPGAATGIAVFDADLAEEWGLAGKDIIMVRPATKPDDVHGMIAAKGILTSQGGATSHAAIVARQFGIPAVVGCKALQIDLDTRRLQIQGKVVREGEWLAVDGASGEVFSGQIAIAAPRLDEQFELKTLLTWADEVCTHEDARTWPAGCEGFPTRGLQVWANVDYPRDVQLARELGARGIGLCRTEHMFWEEERIPTLQAMLVVETTAERQAHLDRLLPFQRADFEDLFEAMDGLPVVIRLLDPPLHEFLPNKDDLLFEVAEMRFKARRLEKKGKNKKLAKLNKRLAKKEKLLKAVEDMQEVNPMLGLRGIRLGITQPEIIQMQARAIFEAACNKVREGIAVQLQILLPLLSHRNELTMAHELLTVVADEVMAEKENEISYKVGAMIETPRAALTADQVAEQAEFFSLGTNDLTQMTFGYSRDDAGREFLLDYVERGILSANPFRELDGEGVGELVEMAVQKGRASRPDLAVGACGEHAFWSKSIEFFHRAGLDYVSCGPAGIPRMRLAVAQAALTCRQ